MYKIDFLWEKTRPKSVVLQSRKKLLDIRKKNSSSFCTDMTFGTVYGKFFKINESLDI